MSGLQTDDWTYGDVTPDPAETTLIGLKARWLVDRLPAAANLSVLDYGVGEGKYLRLIGAHRPGARLAGVDIREPKTAQTFEFHRIGTDGSLPFDDNSFDLAVSLDVLEHVASVEATLREIERVLRPGGAFVGFVPLEGGIRAHSLMRLFDRNIFLDTKDHANAFTLASMRAALEARFRIELFRYSYHFLGGTLDAMFFASFKLPGIGPKMEQFWRGVDNRVYRGRQADRKPSLIGRAVGLANTMAYHESRVLHAVPFGACGLHFDVRKRGG